MVIKRTINGIETEIELTDNEIEKAYRIRDEYYKTTDLKSQILKMICEEEDIECDCWDTELPEEGIVTEKSRKLRDLFNEEELPTDLFTDALGNNDNYWECYWISAEILIEDIINDNIDND